MSNTVNITTTTNKVVISPPNNLTVSVSTGTNTVQINQAAANTVQIGQATSAVTPTGNVSITSAPTSISVTSQPANTVTVNQGETRIITVTGLGPQGPQGPQGVPGPSGSSIDTGSFATTGSNTFTDNQIVTGSITATLGFTGSLYGTATSASYALTASYVEGISVTASYALQALSASYAANVPATASYALHALTASYATNISVTASYALQALSSSYADFSSTASYAGSAGIAADADTAALAFEAQYLQLESLSLNNDGHPMLMVYSPTSIGKAGYGSSNLPKANPSRGTIIANSFTGSLSGSATTAISASYATATTSASYALNADSAVTSTSASYASTSSYAIFALETDNATTANTASYAVSASYAHTAVTASRVAISFYGYSGDFPIAIMPDPSSNTSSPIGLGLGGLPKVNAAAGNITATSFTGSLLGTASYATQALSSSYAATGPFLTPELEGNINLNSSNIVGSGSILTTGDIYLSGDVSADNIYSPLVAPLNGDLILRSSYGGTANGARITLDGDNLNANITLDPFGTGIVDVQSALTATGDVTGYAFNGRIGSITGTTVNASFYPIFVSAIQPDQYLEAHSGLSYNPNSGSLTATRFNGGFAGTLASDLNAQGFAKIINLPTPTNAGDAASKNYVDGAITTGITGLATETYVQNYTNARTQDLADNRGVWVRNADYTVNTGDFNRVIPFDATLVTSTIPNFSHSSGVFQNTDSRTRRFLFQMHVAILATSGQYNEADIWFSYNGTYSGSNRRGQVNFVNGDSGVYNCMLTTSWTFTLAQNETVRCYVWAQTPYKVGGSAFGNDRSCLVEVHEIN